MLYNNLRWGYSLALSEQTISGVMSATSLNLLIMICQHNLIFIIQDTYFVIVDFDSFTDQIFYLMMSW